MFKVAHIANDNHPLPNWVGEKFKKAGIDYVFYDCHTREDLEKYAGDADVLFLTSSRKELVVEENMEIFKKVGSVIKCGSGTDNIDHDACTKRGIIVAHTPDDPTEPTSDHIISLLFTAVRQTARQDRLIRRGIWSAQEALPLGQFTGADLGLIGFGRIGKTISKKLSGFDMTIRVFDPYLYEETIKSLGCIKVELNELLKVSQYVLTVCPLNKETRGIVGEEELQLMRRDAILVNGARAGIVNEEALKKTLREGRIKAAAFDVLENHPLKPDDEYLTFENMNFTPHIGGYHHDYPDAIYTTCVEVIIEMSKMQLPKWIANKGVVPKWNMRESV